MGFLNGIGTTEIVVVAIIILIFFGGKKMNEWAKGLGEAGHELKKAKKEFQTAFDEEEPPAAPSEQNSDDKKSQKGKEVA